TGGSSTTTAKPEKEPTPSQPTASEPTKDQPTSSSPPSLATKKVEETIQQLDEISKDLDQHQTNSNPEANSPAFQKEQKCDSKQVEVFFGNDADESITGLHYKATRCPTCKKDKDITLYSAPTDNPKTNGKSKKE
ncbi:28162_t:CDS:2, partial [Racocetra persica]